MIHNGIEYGLMQSYAEGFDILRNAGERVAPPGPTLRLRSAGDRRTLAAGQRGQLMAPRPGRDAHWPRIRRLSRFEGHVPDSGEGRWTVAAAIDEDVPADVLTTALYARFRSRRDHTFGEKLLSALRAQFGGHVERPK